MKYDFSRELHEKGWNLKQLAEYWGMSYSNAVAIARNPKVRDWNALHTIPPSEGEDKILNAVIAEHKQEDMYRDGNLYYEGEMKKTG